MQTTQTRPARRTKEKQVMLPSGAGGIRHGFLGCRTGIEGLARMPGPLIAVADDMVPSIFQCQWMRRHPSPRQIGGRGVDAQRQISDVTCAQG